MKKTTKNTQVETPSIYVGLETPNKKVAGRAVIQTTAGKWHVFPDANAIKQFPELQIAHEIRSLDDLLEGKMELINSVHEMVFGLPIDKKIDKTQAALMCWAWLVRNATPLIPAVTANSNGEVTKKARVSTIGSRIYMLGTEASKSDTIKTPQAAACFKILSETLSTPTQEGDTAHCTEEQLKVAIVARAAELKTRQDPWRIFQYYRPSLLAAKMIRHD